MVDVVELREIKHYKRRSSTHIRNFKDLYRFEEENGHWLAHQHLGMNFGEVRYHPLLKMKICSRCLSGPGYQKDIGQELGVSQATVSRTVTAVIDCIGSCLRFFQLWDY